MMSHTWIYSWCEKKAVFLNFSFIFARFGRFGGFVSDVSVVSLVSFQPFRFVVSGFSTCQNKMLKTRK